MTELLDKIRADFENVKADNRYNQQSKNEKYASLMTAMERYYKIPLLAGDKFDAVDPAVKELYLEISNEREF